MSIRVNLPPRLAAGEVGAYHFPKQVLEPTLLPCRKAKSLTTARITFSTAKRCGSQRRTGTDHRLFAKDVDHPDYGTKKHGGTTAFIVDAAYGFSVGKKEDKLGIRSSDTRALVLNNCKVRLKTPSTKVSATGSPSP